jgi:4-alpha-glucanotransferase
MKDRPNLRSLADRVGILPSYIDVANVRQVTTDATRVALLAAMGLDGSSEATAAAELEDLDREERRRSLPPVCIIRADARQRRRVTVTLPDDPAHHLEWRLELREENGVTHVAEGRSKLRPRDGTFFIPLPVRPPAGYHTVHLSIDRPGQQVETEQSLIVTPGRCTTLAERAGGCRAFGLWTNLYTLRSRRNWGIGDLADLRALARSTGQLGGAFVALNPLHALQNRDDRIGPYCPVSRLFRNYVYLDIGAVPEFAESRDVQARFESPAFQAALARVRSAKEIAYEEVATLKQDILQALHAVFLDQHAAGTSARGRAYRAYVAEKGANLTDYATFLALSAWPAERGDGGTDWRDWPAAYRKPDSPKTEAFRRGHQREIDFHCYVQFEIDRQLGLTADEAARTGMRLGLCNDLAIGSAGDGSDAWAFPELFLRGVKVGAPPDPYCETGQTWGFPPIDPRALASNRYEYWIQLLRSSLAHAGMLRMDHVMGVFRQYWVPDGRPATEGAYVRYPANDLLGILALESRRHGAVIVGEDLGTVPRELPSILARWGIVSSRVMYFERDRRGTFRPAASYSRRAYVTATTHDHPTLPGFWTGRDLEIRRAIGLLESGQESEDAEVERERMRAAMLRRLIADGLLPEGEPVSPETLCRAVYAFLSRTPCPVVGVSLDDLAGELDPVNLPGVSLADYPSWSRRMGRGLDEIMADPHTRAVLDQLREVLETNSACG